MAKRLEMVRPGHRCRVRLAVVEHDASSPVLYNDDGSYALVTLFGILEFKEKDRQAVADYLRDLSAMVRTL